MAASVSINSVQFKAWAISDTQTDERTDRRTNRRVATFLNVPTVSGGGIHD